jgi:hypothetical protein
MCSHTPLTATPTPSTTHEARPSSLHDPHPLRHQRPPQHQRPPRWARIENDTTYTFAARRSTYFDT